MLLRGMFGQAPGKENAMDRRAIEQRSIDHIPDVERHGSPRSLLFVWFAANTSITAVVTGALFVVLGNTVLWALPAIVAGNVVGGFFTSLHSAQGPRLGVPQMIQSRAQFGYYGAILPLLLALTIFLGFYATGLVLGGQALADLLHLTPSAGAVVFALMSTVLAIFGYRHIHWFSHVAAVLSAIVFIALLIKCLTGPGMGQLLGDSTFAAAPFVLGISLAASWQLTFGPYTADYSRYLPSDTPKSATFGWTFAGSVVGGSIAMTLGAFAAAIGGEAFSTNQVGFLADLGGAFGAVVLLAVICGKLTGNTLSSYGGYMSVATIVTSLTGKSGIRPGQRAVYVCLISAAALGIALAASDDFLTTFTNFLLFLLYFMTPWSAVNLVDYYWVRHERYDVEALFDSDGRYGRFNAGALAAYSLGVLTQIPFVNSPLYVGPVAKWLGGAEIAWLVGLVVAGGLYFACSRNARWNKTEPPVPGESMTPVNVTETQ
jgi:NCS1 family nucleobase:cation symporter-1